MPIRKMMIPSPVTRLVLLLFMIAGILVPLWSQSDYSYEELVELARENGLDSSGSRLVLEARLGELLDRQSSSSEQVPSDSNALATVETADSARYSRLDSGDELELQGNVVITVEDTEFSQKHYISADLILYNQALRQLSAEGNVEYRMEDSRGQVDSFSSQKLLFLLDENETLFVDGEGSADNTPDSEAVQIFKKLGGDQVPAYRFSSAFITRNQNNVIIMDRGEISSSTNPSSPYYRITFNKLWILSPGEWGIDGARLFVGNIPLLALPFMYLPGNEVVFHPVFVYNDARGYGIDSTTYFAGRRKASSSPFSFLQMTDEVSSAGQSQMGIFLQPDNSPVPDNWANRNFSVLKLIFDVYSLRGINLGLDAVSKDKANPGFSALLGVGLTRELYYNATTGSYSSGFINTDGNLSSIWNSSHLFGVTIPFRFIFDSSLNYSGKNFSVDLGFPLYSDPYFYSEFTQRSEQMPWEDLILGGSSGTPGLSFATTPMKWELRASFNPGMPESIKPLISSLRFSNFVSNFDWQIVTNDNYTPTVPLSSASSEAQIYAARQFQMPSGVSSISGTIFSLSSSGSRGGSVDDIVIDRGYVYGDPDEADAGDAADSGPSEQDSGAVNADDYLPPAVPTPQYLRSSTDAFSYRLGYSASNNHYLTMLFHSPDETNGLIPSYYNFQDSVNIGLTQDVALFSGFMTINTKGNFSSNFRSNFGFSSLMSQAEIDSLEQSAFSQDNQSLKLAQSTVLHLLYPWYSPASLTLTHSISLTPWSRTRDASGVYSTTELGWNTTSVSSHRLSLNFVSGSERDFRHTASLDLQLPPADSQINGSYAVVHQIASAKLSGGVNLVGSNLEWRDVKAGMTLKPMDKMEFSSSGSYSPQYNYPVSLGFDLKLAGYQGSLNWERRTEINLDPGKTFWIEGSNSDFVLSDMKQSLDLPVHLANLKAGELSANMILSWNHDFLRFTDSILNASMSLRFFVPDLFLLELSGTSRNDQMYRYFPAYNRQLNLPDKNLFTDLAESFNFFSTQDRKLSSFNLQNYSVNLYHDLGDWMLSINYSWQPSVVIGVNGIAEYQLENRLSFYLQWLPISELKNKVDLQIIKGDWTVEY